MSINIINYKMEISKTTHFVLIQVLKKLKTIILSQTKLDYCMYSNPIYIITVKIRIQINLIKINAFFNYHGL